MAIKIVQNIGRLEVNSSAAVTSNPIALKSGYLRVTTESHGGYVAIGTNPDATVNSFHIPPYGECVIKESLKRQGIVGIITGTTTQILFGESNGNYFDIDDYVTIVGASPNGISTSAFVASRSNDRVVLNLNSSSITNVTLSPGASLANTVKVSILGTANNTYASISEVVILVTE